MDRTTFLVEARNATNPSPDKTDITRHLYRMNGAEVMPGDILDRGAMLLVTLEGPWPTEDAAALLGLHDDPEPALRPVSCALDTTSETSESLAWLKGLLLTSPAACEKAHAIDIFLSHDVKGKTSWRVAYFAKAETSGSFGLAATRGRLLGADAKTMLGHIDMLRVH
jgi:hypothetical protein